MERRAQTFADRRVERLILDLDAPHNVEQVADALYQWLGKDRWCELAPQHRDPWHKPSRTVSVTR